MALTYTKSKAILDEIAARTTRNQDRLTNSKVGVDDAVVDLGKMVTDYSGFSADLDALATANPTDVAIQNAKAEKDRMIPDFQAVKTEAEALQTAMGV